MQIDMPELVTQRRAGLEAFETALEANDTASHGDACATAFCAGERSTPKQPGKQRRRRLRTADGRRLWAAPVSPAARRSAP